MPLVVTDQCANCRDCLPVCPVDCFFEDAAADRVYINPSECIGCLCCYLVCPHDAIFPKATLPAQHLAAVELNAARSAAPEARRLRSQGMRHRTPNAVQGRSAATASLGLQRLGKSTPPWWKARTTARPPTPSYDASAGRAAQDPPPTEQPQRQDHGKEGGVAAAPAHPPGGPTLQPNTRTKPTA